MPLGFADYDNSAPFGGEAKPHHGVEVIDKSHRADGRCRQDRLAIGFVVERDIARHDGKIQRAAGLGDAFDTADKLGHDLGPFGIA